MPRPQRFFSAVFSLRTENVSSNLRSFICSNAVSFFYLFGFRQKYLRSFLCSRAVSLLGAFIRIPHQERSCVHSLYKPLYQDIPEHRIVMTIIRKMCKVKFPKLNLNKNKLVLARNIINEKQKHDKKRQKKISLIA